MEHLADFLRDTPQHEEAMELYNESLEIRKETVGENHWTVGKTYHKIGRCYKEQNEYQLAEEAFRKSVEIYRKNGVLDYLQLGYKAQQSLARVLQQQGKRQESKKIMKQRQAGRRKHVARFKSK